MWQCSGTNKASVVPCEGYLITGGLLGVWKHSLEVTPHPNSHSESTLTCGSSIVSLNWSIKVDQDWKGVRIQHQLPNLPPLFWAWSVVLPPPVTTMFLPFHVPLSPSQSNAYLVDQAGVWNLLVHRVCHLPLAMAASLLTPMCCLLWQLENA